MRLIDADKLRLSYWVSPTSTVSKAGQYYFYSQDEVDNAPTIEAEPVRHGKWLFEEYPDGYYHSKCSLCNSWFSEDAFLNPYKYCPNCGACMIKQGDITTEQGDITTKRLDIPTMDEVNDEAN